MRRDWRDTEATAFRILRHMAQGGRVPMIGRPETLRRIGYLADVARYFIASEPRADELERISHRIRERVVDLSGHPSGWAMADVLPRSRSTDGGGDDVAAAWGFHRGVSLARLRSEMAEENRPGTAMARS